MAELLDCIGDSIDEGKIKHRVILFDSILVWCPPFTRRLAYNSKLHPLSIDYSLARHGEWAKGELSRSSSDLPSHYENHAINMGKYTSGWCYLKNLFKSERLVSFYWNRRQDWEIWKGSEYFFSSDWNLISTSLYTVHKAFSLLSSL